MATKTLVALVPEAATLRPTWTTNLWLALAVAVALATVVAFGLLASRPFLH